MSGIKLSVKANVNSIDLNRKIIRTLEAKLEREISSLICSVHGQKPKLSLSGESLDDVRLDIRGCCDEIIQKAREKLPENFCPAGN